MFPDISDKRRILVIGSCGAGKSTVSRRLGEILHREVIHLDAHFWHPGWQETPKDEWGTRVRELTLGEEWIMDGNYSSTLDLRLERADAVVFLDFSRWLCVARVLRRVAVNYGRTRPDLASGCPEKLDLPFIKWTFDYPKRSRPRVMEKLERVRNEKTVLIFRSPKELQNFLAQVADSVDSD